MFLCSRVNSGVILSPTVSYRHMVSVHVIPYHGGNACNLFSFLFSLGLFVHVCWLVAVGLSNR